MFLKLWKHELRVTGKLLGILSAAALSLGFLGAGALRLLLYLQSSDLAELPAAPILTVGLSLVLFFSYLALIIYSSGVYLYLLLRFYRHKFTDEGYLTFTLPVKTWQIFFSSLANQLLWTVISLVVTVTSVGIALLMGTATNGLLNTEILSGIETAFRSFAEIYQLFENPLLPIITLVLYVLFFTIIPMTCITIGAVLTKKHKLLAAFGIYYAINAVSGIVQSILLTSSVLLNVEIMNDPNVLINMLLGVFCVFYGLLSVAGCLLSIRLMSKKLNLP